MVTLSPSSDSIRTHDPLETWHVPRAWRGKHGEQCDIYLALAGVPSLRPVGFLVTAKTSVSDVVAFCPLADAAAASHRALKQEMTKQLRVAQRIAGNPEGAADAVDAVWLGGIGQGGRCAPHWLYGLSCVPLTCPWDQRFAHPRPFCPAMFAAMAQQPKATEWLKQRQK